MNEVWRKVPGFDNYSVSNHGRVRRDRKTWSTLPRILTPYTISFGYKQFQFMQGHHKYKAWRIHRLVLTVFNRPPEPGEECNHKDGDKGNNHLNNLEWVTPSQNVKHAYVTGLHPKATGEKSHYAKLTSGQVLAIRTKLKNDNAKCIDLAREYGVSRYCIYDIRDNKTWREG